MISIITVHKGPTEDLIRTLRSVTIQKRPFIEHVLVDGTASLPMELLLQFDRYISEPDNSIWDAMNKGAGISTGRYLLFLNAGDLLAPGVVSHIEKQYLSWNENVVYGNTLFSSRGRPIQLITYPPNIDCCYLKIQSLNHQSCFLKKDALPAYTEHRFSDQLLIQQMLSRHGSARYLEGLTIAVYDVHGMSSKYKRTRLLCPKCQS